MKKLLLSGVLVILAGCAVPGQGGIGLSILETPAYEHDRGWVPKNFVQIQQAIFRHQAACGSTIRFAVDQDQPSYARVTKDLDPVPGQGDVGWSRTIVLGLQLMGNMPTRARVYSYYTPNRAQIQELYNAILHPEVCPGMPMPPEPSEPTK